MIDRTETPTSGGGDPGPPSGGISCDEALARVYEYLDGELEPELQERIHVHLAVCRRCYPFFDFERLFLDHIRERGLAGAAPTELRTRVEALLEHAGG